MRSMVEGAIGLPLHRTEALSVSPLHRPAGGPPPHKWGGSRVGNGFSR